MEGFVGLTDEVADAEACHLFNGQALELAQLFQSAHFFIGEGYGYRSHDTRLLSGAWEPNASFNIVERPR